MGGAAGLLDRCQAELLGRDATDFVARSCDAFSSRLADILSDLLARYVERDRGLVMDRLAQAKAQLQGLAPDTLDLFFGGSILKGTYVDGISDVDCLLVVADREPAQSPAKMLAQMAEALNEMPCEVMVGAMALTLVYADGLEVQLLPVAKSQGRRLLVPEPQRNGWVDVGPDDFASTLRDLDRRCGHKLVPTIKLAKAAIAVLPPFARLSGYHVENLALAVFADHTGMMTTSVMLPMFFKNAARAVLRPTRDLSGQSTLVDARLGPSGSAARRRVSRELDLLHRSMIVASRDGSVRAWHSLFGLEA